jgi:hypothetical protein
MHRLDAELFFLSKELWDKRVEDRGGFRRLHNEELHNLYASPNTTLLK